MSISILGVILFILLSSEFFIPLRLLGSFFHIAINGKAASDKIFTLLDTPITKNNGANSFNPSKEVKISVNNLSFSYNNDQNFTLEHINLTIEPNRLTVFVGKSGCGKSTLISLLMGFYSQQHGEIYYNHQLLSTIERQSFYKRVSIVSHHSYFFKGSLRDNMLMVKSTATDNEIYNVLEKVNLAEFIRKNGA